VLSMLLLVHVGAALRHHFIKRNDVLLRMLPGTANAK
jgi:cytochrome b561